MIIFSTFNAQYLHDPLNYLINKFSHEQVEVDYGNIFINLKKSIPPEKAIVILVRFNDLIDCEKESIDVNTLQISLNKIISQIEDRKKESTHPVLVVLCPSVEKNLLKDAQLKQQEQIFINQLKRQSIKNISYMDFNYHAADSIFNPVADQEAHIPYSPEYFVYLAYAIAGKWHDMTKKVPFKVIVVDCDNTLWEGVVDEVGIQGVVFKAHHQRLQHFLVKQFRLGKLICLCSKNDEDVIRALFSERASEMLLNIQHLTAIKANWSRKSDNIRELAKELNLGLEQFVFIDDSDRELIEVKRNLSVLSIKMPENCVDLERVINNNWIFEQEALLTQEDRDRAEFYRREQAFRRNQPQQRESLSEFVKSLNLEIICREINEQEEGPLARVSQLSKRTNQFNLNYFPINISDLKSYLENKKNKIITVSASGGHIGNYGLIAAALFRFRRKILEVEYFFLSCRAFGLGIDYRLTYLLSELAEENQINQVQFKFKKTNKNRVAQLFIKNLLISTNKKDLIIDLLAENQTITFIFSTQELLQLDIDKLLDQADQLNTIILDENKEHSSPGEQIDSSYSQNHSSDYLQSILDETQDFNSFVNRFFTNNKDLLSLRNNDQLISQLVLRVLRDRFNSVADLDLDKSLVYLGLDSIKATELGYYLYQMTGVSVSISELLCSKTTIANLKKQILEKTSLPAIEPCKLENSDVSVASWQQERIWNAEHKELLENGTAEFQMLACYEVDRLDIERFRQACQKLITSCDVFGMKFFMDEAALRMAIFNPQARELSFEVKKIKTVHLVKKAIEDELEKKFLMKDTPLIKFIIYQVESPSENKYYLLFLVHHAIFDAVSLKITLDFLGKAYQNNALDTYLIEPIQYRDYIEYQRNNSIKYLEKTISYWTKRLANVNTLAELRTDKEKEDQPPSSKKRAKRKTFVSSFKTFSCLKKFAQEQGVTCYGVISALYSILIAQYTYQDEIVLLTASTGRTNPSFYKTIGFFVNLLVQPFTLQADQSLTSYIIENYKNWLQDQQNEEIPFERIQEILKKKDIQDIFSVPALIYQNYTPPELILDDQSAQLFFPQHSILFDQRTTCHFGPFTLFVSETEQGFHFLVEYEQACFSETLIEKISTSFLALLDNVVENPHQLLKEITCLSPQQWSEIQSLSQGPIVKYDLEKSLVHKFHEQVLKNPEQIALQFADKKINYAKLDQLSTELARQLSQKNVQKNDKVGLCLSQKFLFPIAVLAIWKQGAICVPISNEDTPDRYEYIIQESGLSTLVLQDNPSLNAAWFNEKADQFQFKILPLNFDKLVEQTELNQTQYSEESLKQFSARQGSFIYFTSGSTGKPKGVVLHQYNILRVVDSPNYLKILSHDKVALASDIAFDAAVFEVFIALLNSATLVVFEKEILLNKNQFDTLLHETGVSILWLTAGLFHQYALTYPELFRSLTYLLVGGDAIKKQAIERVFSCQDGSPHYIINGYGPTENSTFTAVSVMTQTTFSKQLPWIPIGRPINNTLAYVVGKFGQPVPLGAVGELVIGGEGLAQGYLNHPDLEQQRFVSYPNLSTDKLYRSGDKVFWSHDDFGREQLCYLERIGEEVKRQGYFVSLEEISHCLKQHPAIAQVVVLNTSSASREKILVAFYILKEACQIETPLEDYLLTRLPHYMLPNYYQEVSAIPLTRNGKVDKKQLLSLVSMNSTHFSREQPILNATEKKVSDLFRKIIVLPQDSTDELDIDKSFFLLGGSSIKAVQLIAEIQNRFNIDVNYSVLKEYSSIRKLSNWIDQQNTQQPIKNQEDLLLNLGKTDTYIDENLSIIFIHPAGGTTDCYKYLIAHLPESYNYFGINDPVITKKSKRPDSISEMASNYLENIQQKIKGNFILAGYSFGGMLSLEIAAQAEEKGISTLLGVFLLDTWIVSCTTEPAQKVLRDRVNAYFDQTKQVILNKDYDLQNREDAPTVQTQQLLKKETERMRVQYNHLQNLGFKFIPKKLIKTKINLFKAIELDDSFKDMNLGKDSENNYLSGFVNNKLFVKILVDGDHYSILDENNSVGIARHFSMQLQKIITELDLSSKDKNRSLLFRSSKNDSHFSEDSLEDYQQSNTIFRVK